MCLKPGLGSTVSPYLRSTNQEITQNVYIRTMFIILMGFPPTIESESVLHHSHKMPERITQTEEINMTQAFSSSPTWPRGLWDCDVLPQ